MRQEIHHSLILEEHALPNVIREVSVSVKATVTKTDPVDEKPTPKPVKPDSTVDVVTLVESQRRLLLTQ